MLHDATELWDAGIQGPKGLNECRILEGSGVADRDVQETLTIHPNHLRRGQQGRRRDTKTGEGESDMNLY